VAGIATLTALVAGALLLAHAHPLVAMSNDHDGRPLFPVTWPGEQAVSASVQLGNEGLLPYTYRMQAREPMPADARIEIIRISDGAVLYSGRLDQRGVDLGQLSSGHSVRLRLVLMSSAGDLVTPTLVWSARANPPSLPWSVLMWAFAVLLAVLDVAVFVGWLLELRMARRLELEDREW
jgi:hypothetical protein